MASKQSLLYGLIASDLRNPRYIDFLRSMEIYSKEKEKSVFIADSQLNIETEIANIQMMLEHQAEGVVIFPVHDYLSETSINHLIQLKKRKYPFIVMGKIEGNDFDCIFSDDLDAGESLDQPGT